MLYYELTIRTNEQLANALENRYCSKSDKDSKDDASAVILQKLNEAIKINESDNIYFFEYLNNEIKAVAAYDYKSSDTVISDIQTFFQNYSSCYTDISSEEITVNCFEKRIDFISDMGYRKLSTRRLFRDLKLDFTNNRTYTVKQYVTEKNAISYSEAAERASELMAEGDFCDEIERIYSDENPKEFYGHPVHYKISAEETETAWDLADLLVKCLYANGRLKGRRIDRISKIADTCYDEEDMEHLFYNAKGGTVVIELDGKDIECGGYATAYDRAINFINSLIIENANDVLVILIEPAKMQSFAKKFTNGLAENINIISISEGSGDKETAKKYMNYLIGKSNIPKLCIDDVTFDKDKYKASEVSRMFREYAKNNLKKKVYTSYCKDDIQMIKKETVLSDAYSRMMNMVGLDDAKAAVKGIIASYKMRKLRAGYIKVRESESRHMVFTGNPGSAKTTVARLLAEILRDEGVLETGAFVECGRADLVGEYVGWTAPAVKSRFKQAKGGILFIDEAYSLIDKSGSFGDEAINTIVQEMENHRDDVIVIFAGYPDKMKEFINKNEGLKSRIAFHINFPDYNADELMQIFELMLKEREYCISAEAKNVAQGIFEQAARIDNFGNGRFVRNVLEQAIMKQSSRLVSCSFDDVNNKEMLFTLEKEDVMLNSVIPKEEKIRNIGFAHCA